VLHASGETIPNEIKSMQLNNNPSRTKDCVDYLKSLTDSTKLLYVYRGCDIQNHNPFLDARIEIWAPEEDTSVYYGRFKNAPLSLGVTKEKKGSKEEIALTEILPPSGVDAGAFYNLVQMRQGVYENLLEIDYAKNNTSIIFCLEWQGFRFLFTGDAEHRSWKELNKRAESLLKPVHFLKVSHHGSHTGTPDSEILEKFYPIESNDGIPRIALVSTWNGTYNEVPDTHTLERIDERSDGLFILHEEAESGKFLDIEFPPYIGNKRSKTVHNYSCRYVKRMTKKNKQILPNYSYAESEGFNGCRTCI
jgi:hypothetical protein